MKKYMTIRMPDNSVWAVPVMVIAENRAKFYADDFNGHLERSLAEDTIPLFEECPAEIQDWAGNNMNWDEVADMAVKVKTPKHPVDFQEGWANGDKGFVDSIEQDE